MKLKELLKNIILSVCAVAIFFVLLEVSARIFAEGNEQPVDTAVFMKSEDSILFYEMRPNASIVRNGISITTNSNGMRDMEYSHGKPAGVYRIAVIGDSVTANVDLNLSDVYTEVLEEKLNSMKPSIRYEVLNFGVNGYSTTQEIEVLKKKALLFEPDMVIIAYVLNDPLESGSITEFFVQQEQKKQDICMIHSLGLRLPCWARNLMDSSMAVKFLHRKFLNVKESLGEDTYTELYGQQPSWDSLSASLDEVKNISKTEKIKIVVVIFPLFHDLKEYKWERVHSRLKNESEKRGFFVIDLLDYYKGYDESSLKVRMDDALHPNRLGNKIAADAIYEKLINEEMVQ